MIKFPVMCLCCSTVSHDDTMTDVYSMNEIISYISSVCMSSLEMSFK